MNIGKFSIGLMFFAPLLISSATAEQTSGALFEGLARKQIECLTLLKSDIELSILTGILFLLLIMFAICLTRYISANKQIRNLRIQK